MLWYVATPYTNFSAGRTAAFIMACRVTAELARAGLEVYSPIAHSHPVAVHGGLDAVDHEFWVRFDKPMVDRCDGLIVVTMEDWARSRGVTHEIREFERVGKPVNYWDPACNIPLDIRVTGRLHGGFCAGFVK